MHIFSYRSLYFIDKSLVVYYYNYYYFKFKVVTQNPKYIKAIIINVSIVFFIYIHCNFGEKEKDKSNF